MARLSRGVMTVLNQSGAGGGCGSGLCNPCTMRKGRGVLGDGVVLRKDEGGGYFGCGSRKGGRYIGYFGLRLCVTIGEGTFSSSVDFSSVEGRGKSFSAVRSSPRVLTRTCTTV